MNLSSNAMRLCGADKTATSQPSPVTKIKVDQELHSNLTTRLHIHMNTCTHTPAHQHIEKGNTAMSAEVHDVRKSLWH